MGRWSCQQRHLTPVQVSLLFLLGFLLLWQRPWSKATWGRERLISAYNSGNTPSLKDIRARTQIGNLEAGTEAELWMKGAYWLVCHGFLHLLSYTTQDHLCECGSILNSHGLSTPANINHRLATGQLCRGIFSIKNPSSKICLYLCWIDKKNGNPRHHYHPLIWMNKVSEYLCFV